MAIQQQGQCFQTSLLRGSLAGQLQTESVEPDCLVCIIDISLTPCGTLASYLTLWVSVYSPSNEDG